MQHRVYRPISLEKMPAIPTLFKRQLQIASYETICFPSIEYAQFKQVRYAPKMLDDNHPYLMQ
jgi:hypothetical protein